MKVRPSNASDVGNAIEAIKGRHLIAFRQRRVVEDGLDKVVELASERHDGLPDMQQFAGSLPYDVNAKKRVAFAMEDDLQASGRISPDLAACDLTVVRDAHLVRHVFLGELLLGLADEADLGD